MKKNDPLLNASWRCRSVASTARPFLRGEASPPGLKSVGPAPKLASLRSQLSLAALARALARARERSRSRSCLFAKILTNSCEQFFNFGQLKGTLRQLLVECWSTFGKCL